MRKLLILYFIGQVFWSAGAQQPALDWASFRQQVLANHPLAKQADLETALANAQLQRARGGFDPKLYADFSAKDFAGKTYYQYGEAGIKWPTWAGLEFKGAYNTARG
ncbi:MAG: TolC family protein, partial [Saprospiraceae bacterium]